MYAVKASSVIVHFVDNLSFLVPLRGLDLTKSKKPVQYAYITAHSIKVGMETDAIIGVGPRRWRVLGVTAGSAVPEAHSGGH